MEKARTIESMRKLRAEVARGLRLGFVPTMGALHEGHLSLIRTARAECDVVVVSIFVNPTQFGPNEDFASYPRSEEDDLAHAREAGADYCFLPSVEEMYPPGAASTVSVGELGAILEGADRPGHFDGVATVVAKLFNIVQPHRAYFGHKDAQQIAVVKQMVRDLYFDVDIVVGTTVRESDGLAMSSRNVYLSAEERARATSLHDALRAGAEAARSDGIDIAEKVMWELLVDRGVEPSYARAVDPETFRDPDPSGPILLVIAARVGTTRLIDNLLA